MEIASNNRAPFQGVANIIRFNRHFFVIAFLAITALTLLAAITSGVYKWMAVALIALIIVCVSIPLFVSWYIYDRSNFYTLNWLQEIDINSKTVIANIHAGFDETSSIIKLLYPQCRLNIYDFYDPLKHTEISIKRARKIYPPCTSNIAIKADGLIQLEPCPDLILLIFAAHEIRHHSERVHFFSQLNHQLAPNGRIVVVEHLRDLPNLLTYNVGGFHFHSRNSWLKCFAEADLNIISEKKINPFVRIFTLGNQ